MPVIVIYARRIKWVENSIFHKEALFLQYSRHTICDAKVPTKA